MNKLIKQLEAEYDRELDEYSALQKTLDEKLAALNALAREIVYHRQEQNDQMLQDQGLET